MKVRNASVILLGAFLGVWLTGCRTTEVTKEENTSIVQAQEKISTVESVDGSSIFSGSRGQGEATIVLIHCWTCNHQFWQPQIDYFSQNYQVVWLDLASHGKSESQRQKYTISAFGSDVAAVVNQVASTDKIILVGHSMGGPVAIEAAKLLGDKVIGIVGVDTFYTPFEFDTSEEKIKEFVKPFEDNFQSTSEQLVRSMFTPAADPQIVESIVEQMGSANQEMAVSAMYELFKWNGQVTSELEPYSSKLRNINGAPTGEETALHESVTLIPDVGHFVAQVKPDEFNQVLESIIAQYLKQ